MTKEAVGLLIGCGILACIAVCLIRGWGND